MADTAASIVGTVDSDATPPAASTAIQGFSKLLPIDVNANDLASMADTAYNTLEPSSGSSSAFSISDDPPDNSQEEPLEHHSFQYPGATSVAPLDDMETELPEEDPDPVMGDTNMLNSSTTPLSSVGDQQQTLGDPHCPPGTHIIIHKKPSMHCSWVPHGINGWYLGPALNSYRCYTIWATDTQAQHIANTITWLPSKIPMPTASSADYIKADIANIAHALQFPSPNLPLAPLYDSQVKALQQLMIILHGTVYPNNCHQILVHL